MRHIPSRQWQTRFDGRGFTTKPEGTAWQWGLELQSYGFAGQERAVKYHETSPPTGAAFYRTAQP